MVMNLDVCICNLFFDQTQYQFIIFVADGSSKR